MLDPQSEVLAQISSVRAGFTPRSEVIAQRGWRAEDIDTEIAADNARADRLKLTFDTDPRKVTSQGMAQQQPPDPSTDPNGGNNACCFASPISFPRFASSKVCDCLRRSHRH